MAVERELIPNPALPGYFIEVRKFGHKFDDDRMKQVIPEVQDIPAGFEAFAQRVGDKLHIGLKPIVKIAEENQPKPEGDGLEKLKMEDLKTIAPQEGAAYTSNTTKPVLIGLIREARAKKAPPAE